MTTHARINGCTKSTRDNSTRGHESVTCRVCLDRAHAAAPVAPAVSAATINALPEGTHITAGRAVIGRCLHTGVLYVTIDGARFEPATAAECIRIADESVTRYQRGAPVAAVAPVTLGDLINAVDDASSAEWSGAAAELGAVLFADDTARGLYDTYRAAEAAYSNGAMRGVARFGMSCPLCASFVRAAAAVSAYVVGAR